MTASSEASQAKARWQQVCGRVDEAARAAGRARESVALLAVSKLQPTQKIRDLFAAGVADWRSGSTLDDVSALPRPRLLLLPRRWLRPLPPCRSPPPRSRLSFRGRPRRCLIAHQSPLPRPRPHWRVRLRLARGRLGPLPLRVYSRGSGLPLRRNKKASAAPRSLLACRQEPKGRRVRPC